MLYLEGIVYPDEYLREISSFDLVGSEVEQFENARQFQSEIVLAQREIFLVFHRIEHLVEMLYEMEFYPVERSVNKPVLLV